MSKNVFRMSSESRIQITVKLPPDLHSSLSKAIKEGKYQSMTAAILTALQKELQEPIRMSTDIQNTDTEVQRLTLELQKNVSDLQAIQMTFEDIHRLTEEKDKRIEEKNKHIETFKSQLDLLVQQLHTKDEQIEKLNENMHKQAVHTQSLIQEISRFNIKSLPEAPTEKEIKKPWYKFW